MANNPNVNKVIYGNQTVMDITDTTATESDVADGAVFYKANGARSVGTATPSAPEWGDITGTLSDQTDLQTALNSKFDRSEQRVLGAKNLLPNNASTQTINGVTFTVNADGSVTANGTASADAELTILNYQILKAGIPYILSGCPANGSGENYRLQYRCGSIYQNDMGASKSFTLSSIEGTTYVKCIVSSGYTASNLTFYPMLRLASDSDDTYVPYAMTNKELTDRVNSVDSHQVVNYLVTASAGQTIRIPTGTDTDSKIHANSSKCLIRPICDDGDDRPLTYSSISVYDGYIELVLAEDIILRDIGVEVINYS